MKILVDSPLAQANNLAAKLRMLAFSVIVRSTQDAIDQCFNNAESKDYKKMLTPKGILPNQLQYSSSVPVLSYRETGENHDWWQKHSLML